jgi:hypothetical protein
MVDNDTHTEQSELNLSDMSENILNQTIQDWYTFWVAGAVRASLQPLPFVRMAHATRGGRCKMCTNVLWFDLVSALRRGRETHAEQEGSARLSISGSLLCLAASLRRIDNDIGHAAALV